MKQVNLVLHYYGSLHSLLHHYLSQVFANGWLGNLIRGAIELFVIPFVVALIPGTIYWLIKRQQMPYLFCSMWGLWLILLTMMALA